MQVGNGESCRFWSDNWSPFGKLSQFLLSDQTSGMGISLKTTIADLFVDGNWRLPPPRSESMLQLHIFFTTLGLTETEDRYEWIVNDKPSSRYSTSEIYRKLRDREETVPWASIVWIGRGIPRHNFLTWLLNQGTIYSICVRIVGEFGWRFPEDVTCNR
uniref:Reverse transcriptase zinc-binding domain-containing protein n=1 Tax=Brassica oleracea var. oleracea TaxID=109376 RepID=A0A0D2ZXU3_BRAOL